MAVSHEQPELWIITEAALSWGPNGITPTDNARWNLISPLNTVETNQKWDYMRRMQDPGHKPYIDQVPVELSLANTRATASQK